MTVKKQERKSFENFGGQIPGADPPFALNLDATQIAILTGLNRNTVNRFLKALRERIAQYCKEQSPLSGEIEANESFFGPRRVKGKRGRGAFGKTIVFGLFKRNGKIYTELVPNCFKNTPQAIIRGKVSLESPSPPMDGEAIVASSRSGTGNTFVWMTGRTRSYPVRPISTGLKDSGDSPNPGSHAFGACVLRPFIST